MTNWSRRQKLQIKNISTINKFARYFRLQNKPSSGAKREITKALCYFVGLVNLALLRQRNIFICIFSFFVCFFVFGFFLFRTSFSFFFYFFSHFPPFKRTSNSRSFLSSYRKTSYPYSLGIPPPSLSGLGKNYLT